MRRREFIVLLGNAAVWPTLAAQAQQRPTPVIGFLGGTSAREWAGFVDAFRRGLAETGHVDGQNVAIEFRWAEGRFDRLPTMAADLVERKVGVIVASGGTVTALAAKKATGAIPIVFLVGSDPVKFGLVESLNRPGANVTGVSFLLNALVAKRLEMLRELVPAARSIGLLVNPKNPNAESDSKDVQDAARVLGLAIQVVNASTDAELDRAFASLAEQQVAALIMLPDPFFIGRRDHIVALSARHALPAMYDRRELALAGGLISYGTSFTDAHYQAGIYTGRILKGAKPAELPVVQSTRFELVINLKTAKALGVEVPPTLLARADEVIE